jgi:hypothetical protein
MRIRSTSTFSIFTTASRPFFFFFFVTSSPTLRLFSSLCFDWRPLEAAWDPLGLSLGSCGEWTKGGTQVRLDPIVKTRSFRYFSKPSRLSLMTTYRMSLISAKSISLDITFNLDNICYCFGCRRRYVISEIFNLFLRFQSQDDKSSKQ